MQITQSIKQVATPDRVEKKTSNSHSVSSKLSEQKITGVNLKDIHKGCHLRKHSKRLSSTLRIDLVRKVALDRTVRCLVSFGLLPLRFNIQGIWN